MNDHFSDELWRRRAFAELLDVYDKGAGRKLCK
jgi:hypothetical protein